MRKMSAAGYIAPKNGSSKDYYAEGCARANCLLRLAQSYYLATP